MGSGTSHSRRADAAAFAVAAAGTLAFELWLAQRRFEIFGSWRRAHSLDTPAEFALFVPALLLCHVLLLLLLWTALRRLHRGRGERLLRFNFLFAAVVLIGGAAFARDKVFAYLSEAADLQTIRNLAGGSLGAAFVYVLDEARFLLVGLAVAAASWLLLHRLLALRRRPGPPVGRRRGGRRSLWLLALALAAAPLFLFEAGRIGSSRAALERLNAPWLALALLDRATDFDGDGYSWFSAQRDAHPFDPARHPNALDVPDDGVDQDGLAGDYHAGPPIPPLATPTIGPPRKHVVLIVLESVRAEALTKTWNGRPVAPNLAALAAQGGSVSEAWSHVGSTAQSLKTLFTGELEPLPGAPSLFADFRRNGYRVASFSTQAADFGGVAESARMRANSDIFVDARSLGDRGVWRILHNVALVADGRTMLQEMDRRLFAAPDAWRRPTFVYLNLQAAHFPYDFPGTPRFLPGPPIPRAEIGRDHAEWVARSYWNAVAYADWQVGQVLARLKAAGVLEDSVVLVVGDHGEALFESGFVGHGQGLTRIQMQVPLVTNVPGLALPRPAGLADVRRILLSAAGATIPPQVQRPVFQYTGTLDRPSSIGLAEAGGRLTALRLDTEDVTFEDMGLTRSYRSLAPGSALRRRADAVVQRWEEERWARHLRLGAGRR